MFTNIGEMIVSEIDIMCNNSLRRECDNEDHSVRGIELKIIGNLRLESTLEYVEEPLRKFLLDEAHA